MDLTLKLMIGTGALALVLSGCGGQVEPSGAPDGGGGLVGSGSGGSCSIESPVPVGVALSLTGGASSYGESQKNGLELAADQLAGKGGVSYDLKIEDDGSDPELGSTVFEGFIEDRSAIIGPTLSNTAFQAQPIAQEAGVPVLAISNTADGITAQGDYIFRNSLTEGQVIPQTIEVAKGHFGLSKVVVMYSDDDAFTESGYHVFVSALEEQGVEVSDTITFSQNDTDFRALLTEVEAALPDAIVVSALIEAAIPLVTQARELDLDMPIIGGNGFNNPKLMTDAGAAAEGVVVGAAWSAASEDELSVAFRADYEEKFGGRPDQFAAQAYTGLMVIDAAVRANCSGERDDIRDGLTTIKDLDTVLGPFSISADRDAEHQAVVHIVENGAFTPLT